jgi:tetratricopeptide (TPR) repeat protein
MSRFDERRCLSVFALFAACILTIQAQTPAQPPVPAQQPTVSPATAPPPAVPPSPAAPVAAAPVIPLTPEQLGDSLSSHQRYQAAIAAYAKEPNPTPGVWNKMGIAYQMMFNLKDATRCYNASLKLDPRNAQVLNNLATVYDSLKQYKVAERYYRKALKIDSKSALIHRNFGSNQLTQHKYKKGWEAYQAALAIDPQIFQTRSGVSVENPATTQERGAMHYYMAKGCVSTGNSECAINNLRMALNEGYTNPKKIAEDGSFASLHELPAFQQMIAAQSPPQ